MSCIFKTDASKHNITMYLMMLLGLSGVAVGMLFEIGAKWQQLLCLLNVIGLMMHCAFHCKVADAHDIQAADAGCKDSPRKKLMRKQMHAMNWRLL